MRMDSLISESKVRKSLRNSVFLHEDKVNELKNDLKSKLEVLEIDGSEIKNIQDIIFGSSYFLDRVEKEVFTDKQFMRLKNEIKNDQILKQILKQFL